MSNAEEYIMDRIGIFETGGYVECVDDIFSGNKIEEGRVYKVVNVRGKPNHDGVSVNLHKLGKRDGEPLSAMGEDNSVYITVDGNVGQESGFTKDGAFVKSSGEEIRIFERRSESEKVKGTKTPERNTRDVNYSGELPENEKVRLIANIPGGRLSSPKIVMGETSSTGKTIDVELYPDQRDSKSFRLDTATILAGESEYRDSWGFKLYSKRRYRSLQQSNLAPGPQSGANEVTPRSKLPEPTHELPEDKKREPIDR